MRLNDVKCLARGRPSTKVNTGYILCERNAITYIKDRGFPGGLVVKNSPADPGERMFAPWVREIPWRRKWQPAPVFLPGKSHAQRSLAGYSPWGHKRVECDLATKQPQHKKTCHSLEESHTLCVNEKEAGGYAGGNPGLIGTLGSDLLALTHTHSMSLLWTSALSSVKWKVEEQNLVTENPWTVT